MYRLATMHSVTDRQRDNIIIPRASVKRIGWERDAGDGDDNNTNDNVYSVSSWKAIVRIHLRHVMNHEYSMISGVDNLMEVYNVIA